jgi:hypothetical protein
MHLSTTPFILALLSATPLLAAECSGYGLCPVRAASRNSLYAARQHVCGDTDKWKNDGNYHTSDGGYLSWPGGNSQQICWDAFENILNQCRPEGAGLGNHSGSWNWNGRLYFVHGCKFFRVSWRGLRTGMLMCGVCV